MNLINTCINTYVTLGRIFDQWTTAINVSPFTTQQSITESITLQMHKMCTHNIT